MNLEVDGIILYETPFKENSKIIQVLTLKYGLIGIICKGVLSPKSKLRAKVNKFSLVRFNIIYKENKLSTLISADIIDNYTYLKSDIVLISYLTYLCELTYQVVKESNNNKLYNILITSLDKINNKLDPLVITNIVEIKYLESLGIKLELNKCIKCDATTNILTFDSNLGGFICQTCYNGEYIVDKKTLGTIRKYYYIDIKKIVNINISLKVKKEINIFLTNYYEKYTGLYVKSKVFLNKLISDN